MSRRSTKLHCQAQPMIAVEDVEKSSRWYQRVLGCESGHGGDEYEQLVIGDRMIMQLHAWDADHDRHEEFGKRHLKNRGNGVLLWFLVDDFDRSVKEIKKLKAKILMDVSVNPRAEHREIWFKDPDGYTVVVASHYGDI